MNNYGSPLQKAGVNNCSSSSSSSSSNNSSNHPEVWQGNWYDSRIEKPVAGYWIEGYDIKVNWRDEVRYYRVRNDKIHRIPESEAIVLKQLLWKNVAERVKAQVALDFDSKITEEEFGNFVYGKAKYAAQKYIAEEEQRWALEHCVYSETVTLQIAKAIGARFSTQKKLRAYYETNESGRSLKQEWALDDEWFIVVTVPESHDCQTHSVQIDIKPYAPIKEKRRNFGVKAQYIMKKHGVPWKVACILAKIENLNEMHVAIDTIEFLRGCLAKDQSEDMRLMFELTPEKTVKLFFGESTYANCIGNYITARELAEYLLGK